MALWQPFEDGPHETVAYYQKRKIGLVMFKVDSEFQISNVRIANAEVADAPAALPNSSHNPPGPSRTKYFPSAFTNHPSISICRARAPSAFPPSWSQSKSRCCSAL